MSKLTQGRRERYPRPNTLILKTNLVVLAALALATVFGHAHASTPGPRFDVYFLSIGVSEYAVAPHNGAHSLTPIPGANTSARLVGQALQSGGARYGVVLVSHDGAFVALGDFRAALKGLKARIAHDGPSSPLLVVYFAGHGMAEGVAWNHFSIPGDFVYEGEPEALSIDDLADHTLYAASLADDLDALGIPYLLILDTCFEGRLAHFDSPVLTAQASGSLASVAQVLRFTNEFHQESPVLFSAPPGEQVETTPDPVNPQNGNIAPMARRLELLLRSAEGSGGSLTLGDIVHRLSAPDLDLLTKPAVTHATPGASWNSIVYQAGTAGGKFEEVEGSATKPSLCCHASALANQSGARPMKGVIELDGAPGEYITGGRTIVLGRGSEKVTLAETSGDVDIEEAGGDGWELSFSASKNGKLQPGIYDDAQRDGLQDDDRPGLAITGGDRGCNTVVGRFVVQPIHRDTRGRIDQISGTFRQRCDDNLAWLTATLDLHSQ